MRDVSEISGLMGSYLLKGWIMLGDACPSCDEVPLLEDPSCGARYCMRCSPPMSSFSTPSRNPARKATKDDHHPPAGHADKVPACREEVANKGSGSPGDLGTPIENNTHENVRRMISQLSIIGATALENSGIPINERLEIVGMTADTMQKLLNVSNSLDYGRRAN